MSKEVPNFKFQNQDTASLWDLDLGASLVIGFWELGFLSQSNTEGPPVNSVQDAD